MKGAALVGFLALAGCATAFKPAEKTDVVIAISGWDDLKPQLAGGIPSDPRRADLALYFATDRTDKCAGAGEEMPPRVFAFRGAKRVGDAWLLSGFVFLSVDGVWVAPPGKYAFRNLNVRWAGWAYPFSGEYDSVTATSEPTSLAFEMKVAPLFLGQFRLALNDRKEVVLTEVPVSPGVEAAATAQLGVAGPLERPTLSTRELIRCAATGGIRRELVPLRNETPTN
ncbi:MAG TPA: hypothetical protein VG942_07910 [Hyphomonadaceae bacterium]|nr:hypothetical protein [Hyphomonadaceae bacterium]